MGPSSINTIITTKNNQRGIPETMTAASQAFILWMCLLCTCTCLTSARSRRHRPITVNEVVNIEKRATKFNDEKAEMMFYMQKKVNWGDHLAPMPFTAAILGGLIKLSGNVSNDFELAASNLKGTLIKHPESFRATLVQLCHETHDAFSEAHHGMDNIHSRMKMMPRDFFNAIKILYKGSIDTMKQKINIPLGYIKRSVEASKISAKMVTEKFFSLQQLAGHILESCTAKKTNKEEDREHEEITVKSLERRRKLQEKLLAQQRKHEKEAHKRLTEADEFFEKKMKEYPSGGEMWKADFMASIYSTFLGQDTSVELNAIADGKYEKQVKKESLIEEALKISGMD